MSEAIIVAVIGAIPLVLGAILSYIRKDNPKSEPSDMSGDVDTKLADEFRSLVAESNKRLADVVKDLQARVTRLELKNARLSKRLDQALHLLATILDYETNISESTRRKIRKFLQREDD